MRYWSFNGLHLGYSLIFMVGVLIVAIIGISFVFNSLKKTPTEQERIIDLLKVRYAKKEINDDKYYEIKSILEEEDSDNPALLVLKERYASGNLSSANYLKMRDKLN
ncbi:MAG: hypothetical protein P4L69_11625 [Desulfosporosinus sp.]|nr:hypothetical protein [Desulfosporosinus sp.]